MFYSVPFPLRLNSEFKYTNSNDTRRRFTLADKGDYYEGSYPVPGAAREDIQVTVKDNSLMVSYEPKEKNHYAGSFSFSWNTEGLDVDGTKASYKDGVFTLTIPKLKKPEPKVKTIAVN